MLRNPHPESSLFTGEMFKNIVVVSVGFLFAASLMFSRAVDFFSFVETHGGFRHLSNLSDAMLKSNPGLSANLGSVQLIVFVLTCLGFGLFLSAMLFRLIEIAFWLIAETFYLLTELILALFYFGFRQAKRIIFSECTSVGGKCDH